MQAESYNSPSLAADIARVTRQRLRRDWALSHEDRMARFEQLQTAALTALHANPFALQAFLKRNHRARRHSQARRIEALLLCAPKTDGN